MAKVSTGFLIEDGSGSSPLYLMCHTTCHKKPPKQPILPSETDEKWTVPKGIIDESNSSQVGDDIEIETAIRELKEETGIDLIGNEVLRKEFYDPFLSKTLKFNLHKEYKIKAKVIRIYLLKDSKGLIKSQYDTSAMKCTSLIDIDHPLKGFPEVDAFLWVTKAQASRIALKSQKVLFK
ncbi:predicted protein [Naegleria gruberi]|uniref:Predicted protein n=1 Tax=Naegleria gruberi TaxID=5762 RepID=D2VSA5_NAEGR|nr:uncharacterized protein NAEGRDRAFT_51862 [Naegleria gruberi]EFC40309.1 predicted protein [Naegleria gruberi]|eukprot:XP_002673053.1 predicted protein [Naegleria gruberi strain NEG-M]